MITRFPLVFAVAAMCIALTSCALTEEDKSSPEADEIIMEDIEMTFLQIAKGKYAGPNLLWFMDPNKPLESVSDVVVTENEINYTWAYEGKAQTGRMVFKVKNDTVEVNWVDTWHAAEGFDSVGTHSQSEMKFLCHYGPEGEPQWGWRTELTIPKSDQFLVEMYNITPKGEEQIAVRILANRSE